MLNFLYALPDLAIVFGFMVFWGGLVALLPVLRKTFPALEPSLENTDFVLRIQGTLFTMTGFALAITLVQAQGNFRRVEALVSTEASQVNTLDRLMTRYGDPEVAALRPKLLDYALSIVKDEWPSMAQGHGNEATIAKFVPLAQGVTAIHAEPGRQAALYSEMMKALDNLAEARDTRLEEAEVAIPAIYWVIVVFAMIVLVVASCAIRRSSSRTFFLSFQAAILGAFIGVVFITDHPFKGQTAVATKPFDIAIAAMKQRVR
jgi:hypothetical protein